MDVWRWIESGPDDGATQMATDRAVLECAVELGKPTFRVYQWKPHCISLGYNQSLDTIDLDRCRAGGIDVVRRPTGGRAVLHAGEVTYSVIIPRGSSYHFSSIGEIYNLVSRGLVQGIRKLGIPADLEKRSIDLKSHYMSYPSVSCFSAAARHEVVVGKKKLVGSAQRRLSNGILQHGSILTGDGHLTLPDYLRGLKPEERGRMRETLEEKTTSIGGYLGREVDYREVVGAIQKGMEEALSIRFEQTTLTNEEISQIRCFRSQFSILSGGLVPSLDCVSD